MVGKHGARGANALAADEAGDARGIALTLMCRALGHLDSDAKIPSIIGAQLQSAIDALWIAASSDRSSTHLQ